jgi:hypothetical protein
MRCAMCSAIAAAYPDLKSVKTYPRQVARRHPHRGGVSRTPQVELGAAKSVTALDWADYEPLVSPLAARA